MFDKRLLALVPGVKRLIAADVLLQWVALLANIALFLLLGSFLERLLNGSAQPSDLAVLVAVCAMVLAVRLACQTAAQRKGQAAAAKAKTTVRKAVYEKLVKLGPAYREVIPTSKAVQVSVEGVEHLESYFGSYLPQLFYAVLAPLTLFACLAPLSLGAAATLLACVPFIPLSIVAVQKIAKHVMGRYWGSYTDLGATFLESIQGLTTLKIFQADEARHKQMNEEAETFRRATMRLLRMQLNSITVMDLFAFGGAAVGICVTLYQFQAGMVSFGAAFSLIFLSAEFFLPLRTLGSFFHTAMSGMAAADTMFELLDAPEPVAGTKHIDPDKADVRCEGVGYSYDGERTVLEAVDFEAPRGSFVGITGESGSGKSTLAGILSGANGSYMGEVFLGGVDMRDASLESLRQTITAVPYASYLFKGTVRSNLQFAKPDATEDEMWAVLRRCQLDAFVRASGGLDAAVAPEGANLSGGQRQRLSLARALLRDTPIYLFDEATSNIDVESETAILDAIYQLAESKTVIMISHRLAALRKADCIYVLENGRLVQQGTHDELVACEGAYARLWHSQAELERYVASSEQAAGEAEEPASAGFIDGGGQAAHPHAAEGSHSVKRRSHFSVMAKLVGLTKPLLPVMLLAVTLGVLGFAAAIFLTVFAAYGLLDAAGMGQGIGFGFAVAAVCVCGIVRGPLRYGEQICNHYLAFKILATVRDKVFAALRKLAPAKLEGRDKGDLVSLITSDVELLEVFYAHTLSPAAIALIVSVGMVAFISSQSLALGAVALFAYAVVGIGIPWVASRTNGTQGREVRDAIGSMNAYVLDSLRGLSETLQFGRAQDRLAELSKRMAALVGVELPMKNRTALAFSLTGLVVMALDLLMIMAAALMVVAGLLEFAPAFLSIAALASSFGPVVAVANLGSTLQQTLASGERVLDLLEEEPQVQEVTEGQTIAHFTGATVSKASFSYGGERILSDIDFSIPQGSIVQVCGRSGSGKSTLLKLLMRFWDVDSGSIKLSGTEIRAINTASLRKTESFMTQETFLFDGTIKDNLLIAKPDATDAELARALDSASLADFVGRLPKGIDTPVGDLGDSLSGGERQRMGLARVFLHDAPFVLLDEPTSNLDSLNEAAVLKSLAEYRGDKTVVLVSHRSTAAALANMRFSVENAARHAAT